MEMAPEECKVYDLASLEVLNEIQEGVWLCDMNPASLKNYWGNKAILSQVKKTLHEFQTLDLNAQTSPQMLEWNREVYRKVQVDGEVLQKRRTVYPGGQVVILDLNYSAFCLRMPPDESGVSNVKLVCLVHARKVDLNNEAMKEANRAAMLMNFAEDSIFLLPVEDGPALYTNLRARRAYAPVHSDAGEQSSGTADTDNGVQLSAGLDQVLDTFDFDYADERQALRERIVALKMGDQTVTLEQKTNTEQKMLRPEMPLHRKISFTPAQDPFTAKPAILVLENDISEIKETLLRLNDLTQQGRRLLYSMLPDDVANDLEHGKFYKVNGLGLILCTNWASFLTFQNFWQAGACALLPMRPPLCSSRTLSVSLTSVCIARRSRCDALRPFLLLFLLLLLLPPPPPLSSSFAGCCSSHQHTCERIFVVYFFLW
jgi:hypothetical protein